MTTLAWPFLVARTRTAGHRVVVAPDFMVARDTATSLGQVAVGADTPEGEAVVHTAGGLAIVSRLFVAGHADYGIDGDGLLRDGSGRAIRFTEGLVLRGEPTHLTAADLARAHQAVTGPYQRFWLDEDGYRTAPSSGFPVGASPGMPLRLRHSTPRAAAPATIPPPAKTRHPRRLLAGLGAVLVAIAAAAGAASFLRDSNAPPVAAPPVPATPSSAAAGGAAVAECAAPAKSCLVSPAELGIGATTVLEFANVITAQPAEDCRNDRGPGLRLVWARTGTGSVKLDWSASPGRHVDLTGRTGLDLSIRSEGGVTGLDLVITDTAGGSAALPVPLKANTAETVAVALVNLQGTNLASVRTVELRWPQGREERSGICFGGVTFR
ncbi:MAG TPA: hypothetical protein VJT49_07910 [Amycolatopsis sp.]|uniref:hypothetical protein n=1 Tax=Amycolatopsis sp. TaxID=37632 RepID=UPI002B4AA80C|nr:hypothetical protein [Amycolatopsis sp.]HKS45032.1 hypothetical protein [Amycolatopsis sp.]